jgi:2-polyprenyl-3-methyl-5-hydroxy-6-metoxy-1,4-benzoquinol methylase
MADKYLRSSGAAENVTTDILWRMRMISGNVDNRFAHEVDHFDTFYSNISDKELLLTDTDRQRYLNPSHDSPFAMEYYFHLIGDVKNKRVLEIACGSGITTSVLALKGAEVYAYDISPEALALTRKRAEANGLSDRIHLEVGHDIRQVFPGEQFDIVSGWAVLHHLPLKDLGQIIYSRVKPGGCAIFSEPVVNSRVLGFVRNLIPYHPVEVTEDEIALNDRIIADIAKPFTQMTQREFQCISRIYPLFKEQRGLVDAVHRLDRLLMKAKPLRRFASVIVFALYRGSDPISLQHNPTDF